MTSDQEDKLLEWIIAKNEKAEAGDALEIIEYCDDNFAWKPQKAWVSKFTKKNKVASHLTQKKPAKHDPEHSKIKIEDFWWVINDKSSHLEQGKCRVPVGLLMNSESGIKF